jgi:hypothetical protein
MITLHCEKERSETLPIPHLRVNTWPAGEEHNLKELIKLGGNFSSASDVIGVCGFDYVPRQIWLLTRTLFSGPFSAALLA